MLKVGITGQEGFIGKHIFNTLAMFPEEFVRVEFSKDDFYNTVSLDSFVCNCDVIIHLAAQNRNIDAEFLYKTNIDLAKRLVESLNRTGNTPHLIISSSVQEQYDSCYGNSKRESRELLKQWAVTVGADFTGLIIPNVFGPFCKPYYNSVIATFCHQLVVGDIPAVNFDKRLPLIYVDQLVDQILNVIKNRTCDPFYEVPVKYSLHVSEILIKLNYFKSQYLDCGEIPEINNCFDLNLFNTFRSYLEIDKMYPRKYKVFSDLRGEFVELIRLSTGGQISFSTTVPGAVRGNHYHRRKIERFSVIKGKALVQLRRVGTTEIYDFILDGKEPAFIDIPVWYVHNLKNISDETLITTFWISEFFKVEDADTFFENV